MGEYECRVDAAKNRLYIRLRGFFRENEVGPLEGTLREALDRLRPGFDVITDVSEFKPANPAAAEAIRRGGEMVKARGRRHAVRVVGGFVAGLLQFKRLLGGVFSEKSVRYARTIPEAEQILDNWPPDPTAS
ncbi:MAG TPA: hypothetical protein VLA75_02980 [Thermoanaerobaculia bacterium]|nr:hypothetical protein [Thermoanaerobaculia bacterium]